MGETVCTDAVLFLKVASGLSLVIVLAKAMQTHCGLSVHENISLFVLH